MFLKDKNLTSRKGYYILERFTGNNEYKFGATPLKLNLATKITIGRILAGPLLIVLVFYGYHKLALLLFILAAMSDAIDGVIARSFNQKTWLGSFLDPLADKLFLISAFIAFTFFESSFYRIPMWLTVTVFFRDVMIMSGCLFFEIVYGKLKYNPLKISKWTTFFQIICVTGAVIWNAVFQDNAPLYFAAAIYYATIITLFLTVTSGLLYFRIALRLLNELNEKRNLKNLNGNHGN